MPLNQLLSERKVVSVDHKDVLGRWWHRGLGESFHFHCVHSSHDGNYREVEHLVLLVCIVARPTDALLDILWVEEHFILL